MNLLSSIPFVLLSLFSSIFMSNKEESFQNSRISVLVNQVICKTEQAIEKKFKIKTVGVGLAMPDGIIREVGLSFYTKGRFTKEHLRMLLVEFAQELLKQVNTNEEIQSYLLKAPFTLENVQIIIFNYDKDGMDLIDPEITVAGKFSKSHGIWRNG